MPVLDDPYLIAESPDGEQRWRKRRSSFVPPVECFKPSKARVEIIPFQMAKEFVETHHYSGSIGTCRLAVGLFYKPFSFEKEILGGVAIIGNPIQPQAIRTYFDGLDAQLGVEMNRLVLLDSIPFNGESFLIGKTLRLLKRSRPELRGCLSYCDPVPHYSEDGRLQKKGHVGTVYRCTNAAFKGRSGPRTQFLDRNGRVVSERSLSKLRLGERGEDGIYQTLLELGAPPRRSGEQADAYIRRALVEGPFRKFRHPGKVVFAWGL